MQFCEACRSASALRKAGTKTAKYPWRCPRYFDVIYTNQSARWNPVKRVLRLPHGVAGHLNVKVPANVTLPGRIMQVRLHFNEIRIICKLPELPDEKPTGTIGVDLGVNTLLAATDGEKVLLISGREMKALIQYRNKRLASLQSAQELRTKGSRRWLRLQRRKRKMLAKNHRQKRNLLHHATRQVAQEFPAHRAIIGEPFNDASSKARSKQAQTISESCTRKLIRQLGYKLAGAETVPEHYTSQTCPVCGGRQKCRRIYSCKSCGYQAPRDVVGATNIRRIGLFGSMRNGDPPSLIKYRRPVSRRRLRSSGGHPASSSSRREASL